VCPGAGCAAIAGPRKNSADKIPGYLCKFARLGCQSGSGRESPRRSGAVRNSSVKRYRVLPPSKRRAPRFDAPAGVMGGECRGGRWRLRGCWHGGPREDHRDGRGGCEWCSARSRATPCQRLSPQLAPPSIHTCATVPLLLSRPCGTSRAGLRRGGRRWPATCMPGASRSAAPGRRSRTPEAARFGVHLS